MSVYTEQTFWVSYRLFFFHIHGDWELSIGGRRKLNNWKIKENNWLFALKHKNIMSVLNPQPDLLQSTSATADGDNQIEIAKWMIHWFCCRCVWLMLLLIVF